MFEKSRCFNIDNVSQEEIIEYITVLTFLSQLNRSVGWQVFSQTSQNMSDMSTCWSAAYLQKMK